MLAKKPPSPPSPEYALGRVEVGNFFHYRAFWVVVGFGEIEDLKTAENGR
jgi:hypothetical protein